MIFGLTRSVTVIGGFTLPTLIRSISVSRAGVPLDCGLLWHSVTCKYAYVRALLIEVNVCRV